MARGTFGGTASDIVYQSTSSSLVRLTSATLTFWSAATGGTQHTDLLQDGVAKTSITVNSDGQIPAFQGPDAIVTMWASANGAGRTRIVATDSLPDAAVAALVTSSATATRAALSDNYARAISFNSTMSAATINTRLATAVAGDRIVFVPGTYALGGTAITAPVNDLHFDARGATFTLSTWGVPAFDALDRNGWTLRGGTVQYIGTRGNHAGSNGRGATLYSTGCGFWTNGDRHTIDGLRTIGMPTAINFSSWDGVTALGHVGVGNAVRNVEFQTYNFGVLWTGQTDLTIDGVYAHDDLDDSSLANPTHAYYCTATDTFRSRRVTITNVKCVNNLTGHAFQLKHCDSTHLSAHIAENSAGIINILDCDDLVWESMIGVGILNGSAVGAVYPISVGILTTGNARPCLSDTKVIMATNADSSPVSIIANDAYIDGLEVQANRPITTNTSASDVVLQGSRGILKGARLRSVGAEHSRGISVGLGPSTAAVGWQIIDPQVNGQRRMVEVIAASTGTAIQYDPAKQTITGGGDAVVGATADYYLRGAAPIMGQVNASGNLTLTGALQDVPGATVTFTAAAAGKVLVVATFDFTHAASELLGGYLNVDGTNRSEQALQQGGNRTATTRHWTVALTAGSHTLKLQSMRVTGASAAHVANGTHTGFSYQFVPNAA